MTARIVLFGATGYTGRRIAYEMVGWGLAPVLAGRDAAALARLAAGLGGLPTAVTGASSVRDVVGPGDVLVSTVGPFMTLGEPAVAAAVAAGAIYLDSSGEPPFIRRVFEEFGPLAERRGASLLPAFGFDFVPGNLAGALALRLAGAAAYRVETAYYVTGVGRAQAFSRGTFASLVAVSGAPAFAWRDGISTEPAGLRMRRFRVAGRDRPALSVGGSEHFALPRLASVHEVDVYLGGLGSATHVVHLASRLAPALRRLPGAGAVKRTGGALKRRVGALLTARVAAEPDPAALQRLRSHVVGVAYDSAGIPLAEVRFVARDPYHLTARLLAWGAARAAEHGVAAPGALGPVNAFGLDALHAAAPHLGLRHP